MAIWEQDVYKRQVVQNPAEHKGSWNEVFPKDQPLHIEVGMGKGRFLMAVSYTHLAQSVDRLSDTVERSAEDFFGKNDINRMYCKESMSVA